MNHYLKVFQGVTHSAEQLLSNEYHSLESPEVKQSALSLGESLQPCIQELKTSATKLSDLLQVCFANLEHSQDVWDSKSRIAEASQLEIWQQLGDVSGCHFRIQRMGEACKEAAVKQAKEFWENKVESLKKKHFLDAKGQLKKGVGWDDKKNFIKDLEIVSRSKELDEIFRKNLSVILQELSIQRLQLVRTHIVFLDQKQKAEWEAKVSETIKEVLAKFDQPEIRSENVHIQSFRQICQSTIDKWKENWGDILWSQVVDFKSIVNVQIEKRTTLVFNERIELAEKSLEQAISFYDDFLSRQKRYQQETLTQRQAEKAWIEQQSQKLVQVQDELQVVLNQFVE